MSMSLQDPDLSGTMVSYRWLARHTGYKENFFRMTLPNSGYIPHPVRAQFPLEAAIEGLHCYLREQAAKNTKPALDASKQKKLDLEIAKLESEAAERDGKLLTVEELKHWGAEFFPPLVQFLKVLFEIEIPSNCAGLPEAAIRQWCKKKEAQALKLWRDADSSMRPEKIVSKREREGK